MNSVIKIYTDGSAGKNSSSWGFLVQKENKTTLYYGPSPRLINSSSCAESLAILKALDYLDQQNIQNQEVIIYTDCLPLTHVMKKQGVSVKNNTLFSALFFKIYQQTIFLQQNNLKIKFKYTPAHQCNLKDSSIFNRMVDYTVRKSMKTSGKDRSLISWKKKIQIQLFDFFMGSKEKEFWMESGQWKNIKINSLSEHQMFSLNRQVRSDIISNQKSQKNNQRIQQQKIA